MRIEAEQFLLPFAVISQSEFTFSPSASIFDGWGALEWFCWSRVVARAFASVMLPRIASKIAFLETRLALLRVCEQAAHRSGLCVEGVIVFRESWDERAGLELRAS